MLTLASGLVLLRSAVFVFFDAIFDSDQAIVGLMAKHLGEGRALPVFTCGQDYQLAIEAWLAAPLFWLFGPSVLALKLPLLAINIGVVVMLIMLLERDLGLRPAVGLLVASLFILTPPGTAIYFLEASGGQVEPLFATLLLWVTRRHPLTFGVILAVGFLTRVFTGYALGALVLIELLDRSLLSRAGIERWAKAALAFTAIWQTVGLVRAQAGSAWGPATSGAYTGLPVSTSDSATLNVGLLLDRFCFDAVSLPHSLARFAGPFLSTMVGVIASRWSGWRFQVRVPRASTVSGGCSEEPWRWLRPGSCGTRPGAKSVPGIHAGSSPRICCWSAPSRVLSMCCPSADRSAR